MLKIENAKWSLSCLPAWHKLLPKFYFTKKRMIYAWVRKEAWLYIGTTVDLYNRIQQHHIIGKVEPTTEDDMLYVWLVDDKLAHKTEWLMIKQHQPKYNKKYLPKHRVSQMQST